MLMLIVNDYCLNECDCFPVISQKHVYSDDFVNTLTDEEIE